MNSKYDMSWEECHDEGPKTWAFHHRHWTAEAIREMRMTGEWYEDKDADEDEEDEELDDEETSDCDVEEFPDCR